MPFRDNLCFLTIKIFIKAEYNQSTNVLKNYQRRGKRSNIQQFQLANQTEHEIKPRAWKA